MTICYEALMEKGGNMQEQMDNVSRGDGNSKNGNTRDQTII